MKTKRENERAQCECVSVCVDANVQYLQISSSSPSVVWKQPTKTALKRIAFSLPVEIFHLKWLMWQTILSFQSCREDSHVREKDAPTVHYHAAPSNQRWAIVQPAELFSFAKKYSFFCPKIACACTIFLVLLQNFFKFVIGIWPYLCLGASTGCQMWHISNVECYFSLLKWPLCFCVKLAVACLLSVSEAYCQESL